MRLMTTTATMTSRICSNCQIRKHHAQGLCRTCYARQRRNGTLALTIPLTERNCLFDDCRDYARTKGYCSRHYAWLKRKNPEVLGLDPQLCSRADCSELLFKVGLCESHYDEHRKANNAKRRATRPSRAKQGPRKPAIRPGYADPASIRHLVEGRPVPDDFWEFVKYELGMTE